MGRAFGLYPSMLDIQQLFENGNLDFLSNFGTLIEPSTKKDIKDKAIKTPLSLFSHSDQV